MIPTSSLCLNWRTSLALDMEKLPLMRDNALLEVFVHSEVAQCIP